MERNLFIKYTQLAAQAQITKGTKESLAWFASRIRKDRDVQFEQVSKNLSDGRIRPGKMFTYNYDPKLKEQLPYYDKNPLVIILEVLPDGWYGANIHYLPPKLRVKMMEELVVRKTKPGLVAKMLESNEYTKICLKRYLARQLTSRPKEIPREEWEIAIQLPYESFEKAAMKQVWKDSRRKL